MKRSTVTGLGVLLAGGLVGLAVSTSDRWASTPVPDTVRGDAGPVEPDREALRRKAEREFWNTIPEPVVGVRVDSAALARAVARAAELAPLTSLLVSLDGELIVENYYRGMRADRTVNLKSVSKTLLSPLVGIAIRDSLLAGVDVPLSDLLPEYFDADDDPRRREIRLHHVLSMTTGLETTSFGNYGSWLASPDWVRSAIDRPFVCDPGRCFSYSTGNSHLVSVILSRATGVSTLDFARARLFEPLGIRLGPWDRDPQGYFLGGNNMALRPRDLLQFGHLYLNRGRRGDEQLVPEEWISASWGNYFVSPWNDHHYGYFWWSERWGGERVFFAWGYGGQYLVLVPRLSVAAVVTSSLQQPRGFGHTRALRRFFDRYLIPAFRVSEPTDPVAPGDAGTSRRSASAPRADA